MIRDNSYQLRQDQDEKIDQFLAERDLLSSTLNSEKNSQNLTTGKIYQRSSGGKDLQIGESLIPKTSLSVAFFSYLSVGKWGLILAAVIPLSLGSVLIPSGSSVAQASYLSSQNPITAKTIYVDPNQGRDTAAGNRVTPLKTITQALKIAQPNTTIYLAPGTYSEATGEVFPLIIKSNITLEGTPASKGHNTIIKGSGSFISPTGAGQNVTIAALKDAGTITGITVTNPHTRGHGLWIESANPKVTHNTFTRNGNTGLSVNGKSNPTIANNYFYLNLGNGLLVYGTSAPQVIDNEFERTGFGVSAVKSATPTLIGNNFSGNRIGVIFEGDSQGILRRNKITNSTEYGLVAIANSRVDLGTTTESGDNTFYNNGKFDIQNITNHPIPAQGTEVTGQIEGHIDFSGRVEGTQIASNGITQATKNPSSNSFSRLRQFPLKESNTSNLSVSSSAIDNGETLPPPPVITNPVTNTPQKELVFSAPTETVTIKNNLLPVPKINPPSSSLTNPANEREINTLSDLLPSPNTNSSDNIAQVQYRVLVEIENSRQEAKVRSRYPEAFNTVYQGKSMLQIGAFSDRSRAEITSRSLIDLGFNSHILDF